MRFTSLLALAPLAPLALAAQSQQPLQVYLHPTPVNADASASAPTLSPDQARAVLAHHLGENIGDFDEIPNDESLWAHLMGMWESHGSGGVERKARVVIIDGGVEAQGTSITQMSYSMMLIDDRCAPYNSIFLPIFLPIRLGLDFRGARAIL
jgi:hypothetical protein